MTGRLVLLALFAVTIVALVSLRLVPQWVPASANDLTELLYSWGLWATGALPTPGSGAVPEGPGPPGAPPPGIRTRDLMQVVVTIIFSAAALYAIFSKRFAPAEKNWAYGAVAVILGYWLAGSD
ncbi:MAG TPA: hypothetical protein VFV80_14350 [Geminicoccaceae bacterium]|nr:hypothetical protein [Geminicoccaceae bacterium]